MKAKDFRALLADLGALTPVQHKALMLALSAKGSAGDVVALIELPGRLRRLDLQRLADQGQHPLLCHLRTGAGLARRRIVAVEEDRLVAGALSEPIQHNPCRFSRILPAS